MKTPPVRLEPFDRERHYDAFRRWCAAHGVAAPDASWLPPAGAVAVCAGEPCAAQWLYMDAHVGVCQLVWLTTNPDAPLPARAAGARHTAQALLSCAKDRGYTLAMALGRRGTDRLYARMGFLANHDTMKQRFKRI